MYSLETRKLCKSFGALTVAQNIDFRLAPGDRHALIGPNGAGKTTFVNMLMGALAPLVRRDFPRRRGRHARAAVGARARAAWAAPSRSPRCSATCRCSTTSRSASRNATGVARRMWRPASSYQEIIDGSPKPARRARPRRRRRGARRRPALRQAAPGGDRHRARAQAQGAAARRARGRRALVGEREHPADAGEAARRTSPS